MRMFIVSMLALGLVMIVVGASRADDRYQICEKRDGVWHPWVTPKGFMSRPQSQSACATDLANARMIAPNLNLDCVQVSRARR